MDRKYTQKGYGSIPVQPTRQYTKQRIETKNVQSRDHNDEKYSQNVATGLSLDGPNHFAQLLAGLAKILYWVHELYGSCP
jgi:hypothetical protein